MAHDADAQPEPADISVRPVLAAAVTSIALVLGAIWGLKALYDGQVPNRTLQPPEQFPSPRVQTGQAEQRQDLLAAQRQQLTGYAWADPDKTLVRIPIERAMDIIVQRGAEAYTPLSPRGHTPAAPAAAAQPEMTGQMPPDNDARPRLDGTGMGAEQRPPRSRAHPRRKR
jgi:hypothetical protein